MSQRLLLPVALAVVLSAVAATPGCGGTESASFDGAAKGRQGDACQRTDDCREPFVCLAQVCSCPPGDSECPSAFDAGLDSGDATLIVRDGSDGDATDSSATDVHVPCTPSTCPDGCCADDVCITPATPVLCGTAGETCFACDADGADTCAAGTCQCGTGPACTPPQTCAAGVCRPPFVAMTSPVTVDLFDVWGSGPNDVYAVGQVGTIIHWNGTAWSVQRTGGHDLGAVHGTGLNDVWASGDVEETLLHRTTGSWSSVATCPVAPDHDYYHRVLAFSSGEVVAAVTDRNYVCRRRSGVWQLEQVASGNANGLWALWGQRPDHLLAAGPAVVLYDSGVWTAIISGSVWVDGIWGIGESDVWAIGGDAPLHFDGTSWDTTTDPVRGERLWGSAADDVYAIGVSQDCAWHYDGTTWARLPLPTNVRLRGVWGSGANDVFAVGNAGVILHWSP